MPDDSGVYQSKDALRVDRFHCLGGKEVLEASIAPVVVGVFEGARRGQRDSAHTVIPAQYAMQVADQIKDSAKEALR